MNVPRGWASARYTLLAAVLGTVASGFLYPGGTPLDPSAHGYSFTRNFLSDLGSAVAFNGGRNTAGALLFAGAVLISVVVLAGLVVACVRILSAAPEGRFFARLAAVAAGLACVGFVGVALTPLDRAFRLHMVAGMVAFRSFPAATALLAVATVRDRRFRARASVGWAALTVVLVGFILMTHLGPPPSTDRGLITQALTQKGMAIAVLVVLWLEITEGALADARPRL